MKKHVKELEISKTSLKQENANLIQKLHGFGKDLQFIEIQSKSMSEELQIVKQANSSLQNEVLLLKSEKIENLKKIDLLSNENYLRDQKLLSANNEILVLEERVSDLKTLIQNTSMIKLQDLSIKADNSSVNSKVLQLTKENEDLKIQILQKPTINQIHKANKKIANLEKAVDSLNLTSSVPSKIRSSSYEKKYSLASTTKIIRELMEETRSENPYCLVDLFKKVFNERRNSRKIAEFAEKMKDLVLQCSAPGTFPKNPSVKKV